MSQETPLRKSLVERLLAEADEAQAIAADFDQFGDATDAMEFWQRIRDLLREAAAALLPVESAPSTPDPGDEPHTGDDDLLDALTGARTGVEDALEELGNHRAAVRGLLEEVLEELTKADKLRVAELKGPSVAPAPPPEQQSAMPTVETKPCPICKLPVPFYNGEVCEHEPCISPSACQGDVASSRGGEAERDA